MPPPPQTAKPDGAKPDGDREWENERVARLWTPERVQLVVPLAGLGERALAYLLDVGVLLLFAIAALFIYNVWGDLQQDVGALSRMGTVLFVLAMFGVAVLYDVLFEVFGGGRTLGKRALKLRVLQASGRPPDVLASFLRNVMRLVDILPFGYAVGTVALFLTGTRRLGDLVADTFVVTERARARDPLALVRFATSAPSTRRPWTDDQLLLAVGIVERTASLDQATASTLCARALAKIDGALAKTTSPANARTELASQILAHLDAPTGVVVSLQRLVDAETSLARALVSLKDRKASMADVERVDHAIRRGASELMRAVRRNVPARQLESLSLALLDAERRRVPRAPLAISMKRFFLYEVPSTVWAERGLVARAGAVLAVGLFVGGALAFSDAEMARTLIGTDLASAVERGANWTTSIEDNEAFAQVSVQIILNNVGVGLRVFALGIIGGIATMLGLLMNGLQIGATFGYALRLDTADTLLRFVLAHGPVELTMISVAGAGGMCLGRALLSPGRRTRLQALREEGARGAKLVVAASLGFMCIGMVEGFVSPGSMFPWPVNAAIGFTLLALFWVWVRAFSTRTP